MCCFEVAPQGRTSQRETEHDLPYLRCTEKLGRYPYIDSASESFVSLFVSFTRYALKTSSHHKRRVHVQLGKEYKSLQRCSRCFRGLFHVRHYPCPWKAHQFLNVSRGPGEMTGFQERTATGHETRTRSPASRSSSPIS